MSGFIHAIILGAAGYGGGELLRWLGQHPHVSSIRGVSRSHAGQPFWTAHPNLRGFTTGSFEPEMDWASLPLDGAIVVFSAMGHGELAQRLPALEAAWAAASLLDRLTLIDLSGDFRLQDPDAYASGYGAEHPCPERLQGFVYGLPEWNGEALRGERRIANPGCFATAIQLALLPLANRPDLGFVAVSGITGSSGSGTLPQEGTHHPTRAQDFRAYKVLGHQHGAEVEQLLGRIGTTAQVAFVPHSAPLVRGIFVTVQFQLPTSMDAAALHHRFDVAFDGRPFIRRVEGSPRITTVVGTNVAEVALHLQGRNVAILVALDNLGKGMASQAIQNMNLALGLPEVAGLWVPALYPG